MEEAKTLYRSVSLPELVDIAERGVIVGGGSLFNPFEGRPDVFFADEIDDRLIGHGEHIPRQVTFALRNHPISRRSDIINRLIRRRAEFIASQMRADGLRTSRDLADDLCWGVDVSKARSLTFAAPKSSGRTYARHFRALRRLMRKRDDLSAAWEREASGKIAQAETTARASPYSSAIIVTKPITGGRVYLASDGLCGHGEREYGFEPGRVSVSAVAEVILIKDRRQVCRIPIANLADLCSSLPLGKHGSLSTSEGRLP